MKKLRMNTIITTIFVLMYMFILSSSSVFAQTDGSGLKKVIKKGELVVGLTGNQPPLNAVSKTGEIIGLEADVARSIAEAMGVRIRFEIIPFAELLEAVETNKIDMIISGMTITPKRNLKAAFVGPYLISGKGMLTKKKTLASIESASELNISNIKIAVLKDSTSQTFTEKQIPKAKIVHTKNYDEAVSLLIDDKVDVFIADYPICALSTLRYPDQNLISLPAPLTFEPLGIALYEPDPLLINWLENYMSILEGSGRLERMSKFWFEDISWLKKIK